jgi:DNA-binding MarR family transcriptional regulator
MKRKLAASKTKSKTARRKKPTRGGGQLEKVLALVRAQPGIRPSELNRRLKLDQSDGVRATLIERGLIRKEKDGTTVRHYAI